MAKSRSAVLGMLLITVCTLFLIAGCDLDSSGRAIPKVRSEDVFLRLAEATLPSEVSAIQVWISAANTTTSWDQRDPERRGFDLPLLTLHREREATTEADRTLELHIAGLAGGSAIQLEAVSFHVNVATGQRHAETARSVVPDGTCTAQDPCLVRWTLDATMMPSDFYRLYVKDEAGNRLWQNPYPERPDFVALDTWDVAAGDFTVRVYYGTLFPFAKGQKDFEDRLPPDGVAEFIASQFVPIIAHTWHTQVEEWGFGDPIHPDWDADRLIEIIITDRTFALFGGIGTCSTSITTDGDIYPERRIWWRSSMDNFQAYDSLEDAYRVAFAHEFFHMMQWNIRLFTRWPTKHWLNLFIEAQGTLASAVQYPELELGKQRAKLNGRQYSNAANRFLTLQLNASYRDLEADATNRYDAALYWRFLYEQFNNMDVIRVALEEMTAHYDADVLVSMGSTMDSAFAHFDGPFHTFEESLVAFARANYALRLENGRCAETDSAECGGLYYDPEGVYVEPPLETVLDFGGNAGAPLTYSGAIPSSYGMDFIDVRLDPTLHGQPLTIGLHSEGTAARFHVQIWKLGPGAFKPRAVTPQLEVVAGAYVIPSVDTTRFDRLALIITRLDSHEITDPIGAYHLSLESTR